MVRHLSDILEVVWIMYSDGSWEQVSLFGGARFSPYYPGIRADLDLRINNNIMGIVFRFNKVTDYSIEIQLDDSLCDTWRPLIQNKMRNKGSSIILTEKQKRKYFVSIRQEIFDEEDKSKNCQSYPNKDFESYAECDAFFTKAEYQTALQELGDCEKPKKEIIPIYASNDFDQVTTVEITNCSERAYYHPLLYEGTLTSTCPTPCNITHTNTVLTSVNTHEKNDIRIVFDKKVLVTSTTVDRFNLMESLNFFGSNLGLWPGLGIFQLLEWLFENAVLKINFKSILKWKCNNKDC